MEGLVIEGQQRSGLSRAVDRQIMPGERHFQNMVPAPPESYRWGRSRGLEASKRIGYGYRGTDFLKLELARMGSSTVVMRRAKKVPS